jgi:hypothetical protein
MILLVHSDPLVASSIQDELAAFPILAVRSMYSVLNLISDPRYELLIVQESLIKPWIECIEGQRPAMPIIAIGDEVDDDEWSRRTLRNAVIALSDRKLLDYLASVRPAVELR